MTSGFSSRYFHTRHQYPPPTIQTAFPFTSSKTFTNFSKLPTELRLKIWRHCLPKPRAITLYQKRFSVDAPYPRIVNYECFKPHPTILAVNRESRNEALKFYVMIHGPNKFCLAFNKERDTVYSRMPTSEWIVGDISTKVFEDPRFECLGIGRGKHAAQNNEVRIKSLAVDEADLRRSGRARHYLELEELIIVLPSSFGFRQSDVGGSAQVPPLILGGVPPPEIGDAQREFLKEMEMWAKKKENTTNSVKMPVIKVVQWGTLRTEEDFFCVPLTPLSLRKDDL